MTGRGLACAVTCLALACAEDTPAPVAPPSTLRLVAGAPLVFEHPPPHRGVQAFDVVATDVDLDGDADVLVNWHHVGPFELLENRGGHFRPLAGEQPTGLEEGFHARLTAMRARIARGRDGLYVWHDLSPIGRWQLHWRNEAGTHPGLRLELDTSLEFLIVEGLEEGEHTVLAPDRSLVVLGPDVRERSIHLQTRRVGVRLALRRRPVNEGAPLPPLFVGPELEPAPQAEVVLWKGDPHGMAWLDLVGTPHPDLFVTRGGLGGELVPPRAPKQDAYFVHGGGAPPPYRLVPGIPPDHGRGRRVEAVDVDGDGRLELWIGCRESPNRLLAWRGDTVRDLAPELGLAAEHDATGTWVDHDGDGWQDLLVVGDGAIDLLRNDAGRRFERVPGGALGLTLPEAGENEGLFDASRLRLVDVDRDGDLDLFLLGYGGKSVHRLYRRDGERFDDVTAALGLAHAEGGVVLLVLDLDDDALPDVVRLGEVSALWHNRGVAGFERTGLPLPMPKALSAATVLDADGDGPRDVLVVGRGRRVLFNQSQHGNAALEVVLSGAPPPVGALVTAEYADGSRLVQRYGSETSTPFSQALQPLRFGVPKGLEIESVTVRWPGERDARRHPVDGRAALRLER